MPEFVIEENEEYKTTFRIDKHNVVFSDYDIKDSEDEPVILFSIPHKAFELAMKFYEDA